MAKQAKRLTRAQKIEMAKAPKPSEVKPTVDVISVAVEIYKGIEQHKKMLDQFAREPCECDYDCGCFKAEQRHEQGLMQKQSLWRKYTDQLRQAAMAVVNKEKADDAQRYIDLDEARKAGPEIELDLCKYLEENLPADKLPIDYVGYASKEYWKWEERVATPLLQSLGFKHFYFVNAETDSFGPLSRETSSAVKDGRLYRLWYA